MPTKRARKPRNRRGDVDPVHWAMLTDEPIPEHENPFAPFTFDRRQLWDRHRDSILDEWIKTKPGTRPQAWWLFDAPRQFDLGEWAGCPCAMEMCEPRKLLKGTGQPGWEQYNILPRYHLGIPAEWSDGDPEKLVFESQYEYLKRFGLLAPGEGRSTREPVSVPERVMG